MVELREPDVGNFLGKYRLIADLGRGGMAVVYLALASGLPGFTKLVVVKVLRKELTDDPEFLSMFLDEARLAARLNHPNVVQTNEVGEDTGRHFIAMEYLEGQSLHAITARAKRLNLEIPTSMRVGILIDALTGLHYAHELRDFDGSPLCIVHRDMTPQNIFVTYAGTVKIVDFGVAKASIASVETRAGVLKGKVGYMSPEQCQGARLDGRSDLFSMGVILWEAIARRRVWAGQQEPAIMVRLLSGDIPSLREACPDVPEELEAICTRALQPDPAKRYPTALALRNDLVSYAERHWDHIDMGATGAFVGQYFAKERDDVAKIVEEQVRRAQFLTTAEYAGASLPEIAHQLSAKSSETSDKVLAQGYGDVSQSGARIPLSSSLSRANVSSQTLLRRRIALAAIAASTVVVIGAGVMRLRHPPDTVAAPSDSSNPLVATAAVSAPSVSATSRQIRVVLSAEPSSARLFLDNIPLDTNPYTGVFMPDGLSHRVHAVAQGFQTQAQLVTFERDLDLTLTLSRAAQAAVPAARDVRARPKTEASPVAVTTTAPISAATNPGPSKKAKVKIDTKNPWDP